MSCRWARAPDPLGHGRARERGDGREEASRSRSAPGRRFRERRARRWRCGRRQVSLERPAAIGPGDDAARSPVQHRVTAACSREAPETGPEPGPSSVAGEGPRCGTGARGPHARGRGGRRNLARAARGVVRGGVRRQPRAPAAQRGAGVARRRSEPGWHPLCGGPGPRRRGRGRAARTREKRRARHPPTRVVTAREEVARIRALTAPSPLSRIRVAALTADSGRVSRWWRARESSTGSTPEVSCCRK